ncbi:MAG: hypothetical protein ACYC05_11885 [Sulfuricella sp.]|nr:hypothetical protein [Gammaproteobacteria bacterium]
MRFVPSSLPPLPPEKEEGPRPLRAARPVKRVEPRTRVPQVIQPFGRRVHPGEAPAGSEAFVEERRSGLDRRRSCRRLLRESPVLDTRGEERRKAVRRRGEIATTVDEEI